MPLKYLLTIFSRTQYGEFTVTVIKMPPSTPPLIRPVIKFTGIEFKRWANESHRHQNIYARYQKRYKMPRILLQVHHTLYDARATAMLMRFHGRFQRALFHHGFIAPSPTGLNTIID